MTDNPYQEPGDLSRVPDATNASGCSWTALAITLGIAVILISLLLPAVERGRSPARRTYCRNNLKQIGLALHNYHDRYEAFPPAYTVDANGKRLHSWRTLILPYLDQANVYNAIDLSKPWDDPANASAYDTTIPAYTCPSVADVPPGYTTYLGLVGPNRLFLPTESRQLSEFADTSTTLAAIEVSPDASVHWMCPEDNEGSLLLELNDDTAVVHTGGTHSLVADGSVRFLSSNMPPEERRELLSVTKEETPAEADE